MRVTSLSWPLEVVFDCRLNLPVSVLLEEARVDLSCDRSVSLRLGKDVLPEIIPFAVELASQPVDCQFQSQGIGRREKERVVFLPYLLKLLHREAWEFPEKLAERVGL